MKRLPSAAILIAALIASAPTLAQPVALPPGTASSVRTATPAPLPAPLVPESGTADYRLEVHGDGCVLPEWAVAAGFDPFPVTGPCDQALPFNAVFYGGSRLRFEVDRTGKCLASPPPAGIFERAISILPCTGGLEQRYRAEETRIPGFVRLRTIAGQCLTMGRRISAIGDSKAYMFEKACNDERGQFFKLARIYPAGYIAPADPAPGGAYPGTTNGARLGVATPVTPDPLPAAPEPRPRPEGLPEGAPIPGIYQTAEGTALTCLMPVHRAENFVLRGGACNESPWENLLLEYPSAEGFVIYVPSIDRKCLTQPSGGRPWVELQACDPPSANQRFAVVQGERGGYRIKTRAGMCLTLRGNPRAAQNNSALFPEPCREDANEQLFELRLMIDKRDL